VARRWAGGRDTVKDDLAAFGLIEEAEGETELEVWPENQETVAVFLALRTQWVITDGRILGLQYPSVLAAMTMMGVKKASRPTVFNGIHHMESAVLEIINEKHDG
jgi:hypothetical protein